MKSRRFRTWFATAMAAAWLLGCPTDDDDDTTAGDDDTTGDDDSAGDDDTADSCTETAAGTFPGEAVELAHDLDEPLGSLHSYTMLPVNGHEGTYVYGEHRMWEVLRWDLPAPATVHGARVVWEGLPEDEAPVTFGAYPDYSSNGFDFDQWNPIWTGTRCLSAADDGSWVDYVIDPPIEVPIPGLFWVGQLFEPTDAPALMFDTAALECDSFTACHSAQNWPDNDLNTVENGLSYPWHHNYSVRLMVELHDTIPPEQKWFQVDPALAASGRVAWGDYDNDGWDDLMTNGPTLYRNLGNGSFEDVTVAAGLDQVISGTHGGVWGDYDNDGWLDFAGITSGTNSYDILVHNEGDGTFTDVTLASGITDEQDTIDCNADGLPEHSATEGVAWVDLDADGLLDLYLASYECGATYTNYLDRIWHNEGDGTFTEWGTDHGFTLMTLAGRGVSPLDVDRDADMDVFVSNYRLQRNLMYENLGEGAFADRAVGWNVSGEGVGSIPTYYGHTIGSAWIDLEHDGDWDLIQGNLAHPRYYSFSDKTMVLRNDGALWFDDIAAEAGIHYRETHSNVTVQDFDSDGDWDFFVTSVYEGRFSELYFNDGAGAFTQVNYPSGAVIHNGWGSAAADYDHDGDVDLVAYDLFRNDSAAEGQHWLQVRALGGVTANAAGIGAVVEIDASGQTRMSYVSGGSGTACQDSMFLSFGLGSTTEVDEIRVFYPGGASAVVAGPIAADQRVWVHEDGTVVYGWAP